MHHKTGKTNGPSVAGERSTGQPTVTCLSLRVLRGSVAVIAIAVGLSACATKNPETRSAKYAADTQTMKNTGDSLLAIADAMAADGHYAAAIPVYRRAHAKETGSAAPLIGLGRSLMALGQVADAEHSFRDAIDIDDKNPGALSGLGGALLVSGRPTVAMPLFKDALAVDPGNSAALRGLAMAEDMTGQHDEAIATYKDALDSHSDDLKLRNNYGLSLALFGDTEDGVKVLETVLRDDRAGPSERQNMALAYLLAGDDAKAEQVVAIDQDTQTIEKTLDYFRLIKMLAPKDRMTALVAGTAPPKHDVSQPANRGYDNEAKLKVETAKRIVGLEQKEVAETPPPPPPPPAPKPAHEDADLSSIPLLAPGEGWSLQIAAYRKASQMIRGWKLLREKYHDIIGELAPRRSEMDFGDRPEKPSGFYYRLNAGPLTSLKEATEKCKQMRDLGADCWVRAPEQDENAAPTPELFK